MTGPHPRQVCRRPSKSGQEMARQTGAEHDDDGCASLRLPFHAFSFPVGPVPAQDNVQCTADYRLQAPDSEQQEHWLCALRRVDGRASR